MQKYEKKVDIANKKTRFIYPLSGGKFCGATYFIIGEPLNSYWSPPRDWTGAKRGGAKAQGPRTAFRTAHRLVRTGRVNR